MNINLKQQKQAIDVKKTIERVKKYCQNHNYKLTAQRQEILELVLKRPDVIKAYDILDELKQRHAKAAPPTVYRGLEFLVKIGVLHRADALSGFVFCPHFDEPHLSLIMSCSSCGTTCEAEAPELVAELEKFCADRGFVLHPGPVVLRGCWQGCTKDHHCH